MDPVGSIIYVIRNKMWDPVAYVMLPSMFLSSLYTYSLTSSTVLAKPALLTNGKFSSRVVVTEGNTICLDRIMRTVNERISHV